MDKADEKTVYYSLTMTLLLLKLEITEVSSKVTITLYLNSYKINVIINRL
jgi:hypothetical protein